MIKYKKLEKALLEKNESINDLVNKLNSIGIKTNPNSVKMKLMKRFSIMESTNFDFAKYLFSKHEDELFVNDITEIDYIYVVINIEYFIQDHIIAFSNYQKKYKSLQNVFSEYKVIRLYDEALRETQVNKQKYNFLGVDVDLMNIASIFLTEFIREDPSNEYDHNELSVMYAIDFLENR